LLEGAQHQCHVLAPRALTHEADPPDFASQRSQACGNLDVKLLQQFRAHPRLIHSWRHLDRGELREAAALLRGELKPECAQTGVQGGGVAAVAQPPLLEAFFHHHAQGFVERIDHRDRGGVMIHALRAPVAANRGDIEVPGAALGLAPPYHLHRAGAEGYRREPRGRTQSLLRATEAGIDSPAVGFQGDTGERGHRVDDQ